MGGAASQGLIRRLSAEFLGTFILVLFGTGAIVADQAFPGNIGHLGISLVFGIVVMVLVYAYGEISGAHLNPAVTLALIAGGKVRWKEVLPYFPAQMAGALFASICVHLAFPDAVQLGGTHPQTGTVSGWWVEALMTAILMLVILDFPALPGIGSWKGAAIGGVIFLEAMVAGPLTGASMNPVRSAGPALVAGDLQDLWLYLTAPVAGALATAMYFRFLRK